MIDELRDCLMDIPNNDLYVLLGDFNARVGSGTGLEDDPWLSVRGQYGVGKMNDAREELLGFLSMFGARIYNTCFRKRNIHKTTWRHPRSKRWHCIDFAISGHRDARRVVDCRVCRSAECGD